MSSSYRKALKQYKRSTANRQPVENDWTPFRAAEKKYKARFPPVDLSQVLTIDDCIDVSAESGPKAYTVPQIPGLVLLPSFVSHQDQRRLTKWALADHARPPNDTNLDTHYVVPPEGLWNAAQRSDPVIVQPRAQIEGVVANERIGPRQLIENEAASPDNFEELVTKPKPPAPPSASAQPALASALVPKLRWANIGWYYHWGTKQYDFTKGKVAVDPFLRDVCKQAVRSVPWDKVYGREDSGWGDHGPDWHTWEETYEPDAGIVNFYQEKDTLMAHVDRSEVCATSPLVSISLGNTAVFLIGGTTRDTEPVAILLRSGDTVIMSGPSCRRAYHGVPRILAGTLPPHLKDQGEDWVPYEEFLNTARININVRQVFPKGFQVRQP